MPSRRVGTTTAYPVGLGCMPLSFPEMISQRPRALATVHAALDAGMTILDTADIYAPDGARFGHNEELVAEAVRSWAGSPADRERIIIATKGGITRQPGPDGDIWGRAGRPEQMLAAAQASARRLGVDAIDLYYFHRFDPAVPLDDQLAGLAAIRDAGLARQLGLSNVSLAQLRRALELLGGAQDGGIVAVQNEYSPRFQGRPEVLSYCTDNGIAFLPWSPLGGSERASAMGSQYQPFADVAAVHAVTPQQVSLAWLLSLSPVVIPIPGSTRPETAISSAAAVTLSLDGAELAALNSVQSEEVSTFADDLPDPPM